VRPAGEKSRDFKRSSHTPDTGGVYASRENDELLPRGRQGKGRGNALSVMTQHLRAAEGKGGSTHGEKRVNRNEKKEIFRANPREHQEKMLERERVADQVQGFEGGEGKGGSWQKGKEGQACMRKVRGQHEENANYYRE